MKKPPLTAQAHQRLATHLNLGDHCIDATAGNGHDTLFLAQQVGPTGKVYVFDTQHLAIEKTRKRLEKNNCIENCELIHAGHENMIPKVPIEHHGKIMVITFNLGYLPGSEKECTTQAETTLQALDQSLALLAPNGLISLLIYKGHPAGKIEDQAIKTWFTSHPELLQQRHQGVSSDEHSPELIILSRI